LKFSVSIDRNGKGSPKVEFISLISVARGTILEPEDAQRKRGIFHNFRPPPSGVSRYYKYWPLLKPSVHTLMVSWTAV